MLSKFWDWMKDKHYCNSFNRLLEEGKEDTCIPTKQMLVGYMVEYIIEKEGSYIVHDMFQSVDELIEDLEFLIKE